MTAPFKVDIRRAIASLLDFTLDFQSSQEEISKLRSQYVAALDDSKQAIADKQQAVADRDAAIADDKKDEATIEDLQQQVATLKAELAEQTAIAAEATEGLTEILKRFALPVPVVTSPVAEAPVQPAEVTSPVAEVAASAEEVSPESVHKESVTDGSQEETAN